MVLLWETCALCSVFLCCVFTHPLLNYGLSEAYTFLHARPGKQICHLMQRCSQNIIYMPLKLRRNILATWSFLHKTFRVYSFTHCYNSVFILKPRFAYLRSHFLRSHQYVRSYRYYCMWACPVLLYYLQIYLCVSCLEVLVLGSINHK